VISFIQMLATINTPKVQVPFDVSLLHPVLIIQGYNQNYMKYIYNFYLIPFGNIYLFCIYYMITLEYNNWVNFFCSIFTNATFQIVRYRRVMLSIFRCLNIGFIVFYCFNAFKSNNCNYIIKWNYSLLFPY
jgi:hypothetical protein